MAAWCALPDGTSGHNQMSIQGLKGYGGDKSEDPAAYDYIRVDNQSTNEAQKVVIAARELYALASYLKSIGFTYADKTVNNV